MPTSLSCTIKMFFFTKRGLRCDMCSVTIDILLNALRHFNLSCMLYVCTHAAFPVAFFSFLRISNLVPYSFGWSFIHSNYFLRRKDVSFTPTGAILQVYSSKTIHFRQFFLEIPLPFVPNSVLCPLIALSRYLRSVPAPLFVLSQDASLRPTLAVHFNRFFKACVVSVGLNPGFFLSRSFRATFASNCVASTELIKAQGISEAAPV